MPWGAGGNGGGWPGGSGMPPVSPGDTEHILSEPVVMNDPDYSPKEKNDFKVHWNQITNEQNQRNAHLNSPHETSSEISSEAVKGANQVVESDDAQEDEDDD